MIVTDRVLASCDLRPGPWPPAPRTCVWCADPLPKRSRRWCAGKCQTEFTRQHAWQQARWAARVRDGNRCVRCGVNDDEKATELAVARRAIEVLAGRRVDRFTVGRADMFRAEAAYLLPYRLEVNHRTPILGRHAEFGCHHHLDGLETLCHACHVEETAHQFGHRTAIATDELPFGAAS